MYRGAIDAVATANELSSGGSMVMLSAVEQQACHTGRTTASLRPGKYGDRMPNPDRLSPGAMLS
jgi:hypothetical protein